MERSEMLFVQGIVEESVKCWCVCTTSSDIPREELRRIPRAVTGRRRGRKNARDGQPPYEVLVSRVDLLRPELRPVSPFKVPPRGELLLELVVVDPLGVVGALAVFREGSRERVGQGRTEEGGGVVV